MPNRTKKSQTKIFIRNWKKGPNKTVQNLILSLYYQKSRSLSHDYAFLAHCFDKDKFLNRNLEKNVYKACMPTSTLYGHHITISFSTCSLLLKQHVLYVSPGFRNTCTRTRRLPSPDTRRTAWSCSYYYSLRTTLKECTQFSYKAT